MFVDLASAYSKNIRFAQEYFSLYLSFTFVNCSTVDDVKCYLNLYDHITQVQPKSTCNLSKRHAHGRLCWRHFIILLCLLCRFWSIIFKFDYIALDSSKWGSHDNLTKLWSKGKINKCKNDYFRLGESRFSR